MTVPKEKVAALKLDAKKAAELQGKLDELEKAAPGAKAGLVCTIYRTYLRNLLVMEETNPALTPVLQSVIFVVQGVLDSLCPGA